MHKNFISVSLVMLFSFSITSCVSRLDRRNSEVAILPGPKYPGESAAQKILSARQPAATSRVPYAPGTPVNSHDHSPAQPRPNPKPKYPALPENGAVSEASSSCPVPLNRIVVGGMKSQAYSQPYSVMDVLLAYNQQRWVTGSAAGDIALLRPWFEVSSGPGSEVFSALQNSKAWCRASEFVSGVFSSRCGDMKAPDALINPRMAGTLTAILAVRNQPECIREVRTISKKNLGPNIAEIDDAVLPLLEASNDLRAGRLIEKFHETETHRNDLQIRIDKLDSEIAAKEKASVEIMRQARGELASSFSALRKALAGIPPCAMTVKFDLLVMDPSEKAGTASGMLIENCKKVVDKKLESFQKDEIHLTAKVAKYAEKHAKNPDLVETDEELRAKKQLEKIADLVKLYQGYVDLLVTSKSENSVHSQKAKVDALMKRGAAAVAALNSRSYAGEEIKAKQDLEARFRALSARYLTYGFFGGFGNLPIQ